MSGLREKNKLKVHAKILKSACFLMLKHGFEATSMEAVAQRAEVSVGTLYNYYSGKEAILSGILIAATGELLEEAKQLQSQPIAEPQIVLEQLLQLYAHSLQGLGKELLKYSFSHSLTQSAAEESEMRQLDEQLIEQIFLLIKRFQEQGTLNSCLSALAIAKTIYGIYIAALMTWLCIPNAKTEELSQDIKERLAITFSGLNPAPTNSPRKHS